MRVSVAASTFVESDPFPAIVHIFTGKGDTRKAAYVQAMRLLELHRKADVVFRACTANRTGQGVFFGTIEGVKCKTTIRVTKRKGGT